MHTADINGDGNVDLVSGWEQSGLVRLYLNPGRAQVREGRSWIQTDISGGLSMQGIEDAAFADLDLDGLVETIITSVEGDTKSLGIHRVLGGALTSPEAWSAQLLAPGLRSAYMKARAGQIDGVGGADIVAGTKTMDGETAAIYWFQAPHSSQADAGGEWERFFIGEIDTKTVTLAIKNMDADGLADIVYSGRKGVGWFKNPGHQLLTETPLEAEWERIVITDRGSEFAFCDLGTEGLEDIVVATSKTSGMVAKWIKRLDASGRNWKIYPIASDERRPGWASGKKFVLKGVACGFVDEDDQIDLVFTGSGDGSGVFMMSPRTAIRNGDPWNLVNLTPYAAGMKFDNLVLVDMDQDQDLDIVTTEEGEGVFTSGEGVLWFENPRYSMDETSSSP